MKKLLFLLFLPVSIFGQTLAFEGALGPGAYADGWRGGQVVFVTNCNASGAGSWVAALDVVGPKYIIPRVACIVDLGGILVKNIDNTYIAGQAAPDGGTTFINGRVVFSGSNFLIRYIRFKGGRLDPSPNDSFGGQPLSNGVIDHVSAGFSDDEALSLVQEFVSTVLTPSENVTVQYCLFAESASTGSITGSTNVNTGQVGDFGWYNNIWYNISHRFPNMSFSRADVQNNIAWNYQDRLISGNYGQFEVNQINNLYRRDGGIDSTRLNRNLHDVTYMDPPNLPQIYSKGNLILPGYVTDETLPDNNDTWRWYLNVTSGFFAGAIRFDPLPSDFFPGSPISISGPAFTPVLASTLQATLPDKVGANARVMGDGAVIDNTSVLDQGYIDNIKNDVIVPYANPLTDYVVPAFTGGAAYTDSDNDGMGDAWELANGLNVGVDDHAGHDLDPVKDNIEFFLGLVDSSPMTTLGKVIKGNLKFNGGNGKIKTN